MQRVPRGHARRQRQHDVKHGGEHQRLPGHGHVGHAQQKGGDGREGHHHDEVVDGHLHQRVVGVALHQLAPDEHHGRARCHAQQDHAGDVFAGRPRIDPGREQVLKEQYAQRRHGERLDEPVDHQREQQPARLLAHVLDGAPVDLDHHRVDHHPDEHGHHQVDMRHLQPGDGLEGTGRQQPQAHARQDAQAHPNGQISLEQPHVTPPWLAAQRPPVAAGAARPRAPR